MGFLLKQKMKKNDDQPKFIFCAHVSFFLILFGWCMCVRTRVCVCLGTVVPQLEQCQGAVLLWRRCTTGCGVFSISTEAFLQTLNNTYTSRIPEKAASLSETGVSGGVGLVALSSVHNKSPGECWFPN